MRLNKNHKELTNGVGKCSVPAWMNGVPAGFCDKEAYGERPHSETYWNYAAKKEMRMDGRYSGYVGGLACPNHGGDKKEVALNLCQYCKHSFATCEADPKFGIGLGNDNVYECETFEPEQ